jgi:glyoxylase-like metal-dependent hydrolase (beta-lactamase superfamily II)
MTNTSRFDARKTIGRRGVTASVAGMAMLSLAIALPAQQPAQPLVVKQLAPNVYWTQGGAGGNTGIIIGQTSVIVVDAKTTADSAKEMLAEVAKITPKPVTTVILTHSDGDHVNGLAGFPAGLTIIAHENNKKEQEAALAAGGRGGPPPDRLPTRVVTENREATSIDGVKLELLHWAPAHTSGDLVVYLPDQKVVFTGDIIATQRPDPLIHLEKNGSSAGWITTTQGIVALDATQFVPGHGDLQTKADIQARLRSADEKRTRIAAMVKDGKSLDDIKAALGETAAAPAPAAAPARGAAPAAAPQPGRGGGGFASFTDVVYQELTKK